MSLICSEGKALSAKNHPHRHPRRVDMAPSGQLKAASAKNHCHMSIERVSGPLYEIGVTIITGTRPCYIDARNQGR